MRNLIDDDEDDEIHMNLAEVNIPSDASYAAGK